MKNWFKTRKIYSCGFILQIYTKNMNDSRETKEMEIGFIESALKSEEGEKRLRNYLSPLVESKVIDFLEKCQKTKSIEINEEIRKKSLYAGWSHLDLAIKKYCERLDSTGKDNAHSFSAYFTWFIKQGVWDYLYKEHYRK